MLLLPIALARDVSVASVTELEAAVAAALPGDTIVLSPGTYRLESTLYFSVAGTEAEPITLRGEGALIESNTTEAFKVSAPYWHFDTLSMQGICADDSTCEHALHIVGTADNTWVINSVLVDFNAQIKGNGEDYGSGYVYPDDVLIQGNDLHDTRARQTANPVTKVDVVGGQRWRLVANRIADYEKAEGDTVSYAAFFKGNSKDGIMERNLVVCADQFSGGVRLGLSLGGGGTSPDSICEDGTCTPEHQRGILRNNLISNCSDVGIYLNEAADTLILGNTLFQTSGIDVRYEASTALLGNNLLDDNIAERDSGTATLGTNWQGVDLRDVFADPAALDFSLVADPGVVDAGDVYPELSDDFCGQLRDAQPDGGAIEYITASPCDTSTTHPPEDSEPPDTGGGEGGGEGTVEETDTGSPPDSDAPTKQATPASGGCGCNGGQGGLLVLLLWPLRRTLNGLPTRPAGSSRDGRGSGAPAAPRARH